MYGLDAITLLSFLSEMKESSTRVCAVRVLEPLMSLRIYW